VRAAAIVAGGMAAFGWTVPASAGSDAAVTFQQNAAHTGQAFDGITPPLVKKWTAHFLRQPLYPLIADGRVFVSVPTDSVSFPPDTSQLYSLDEATGNVLWGPLTIPNGNVSFNAYDNGRLFNVTEGGDIRNIDPATGALGWNGNYFHLYTANFLASEYQVQSPATAFKGVFYPVGAYGIYAVDENTATVKWSGGIAGGGSAGVAVSATGVYITSGCYATDRDPSTGNEIWTYRGGCSSASFTTPVLYQGRLYDIDEASPNNIIFDASTGAQLGTFTGLQSPAFDGNQGFFPYGGTLNAVNLSNNSTSWNFSDGTALSDDLVANGNVYVGSDAGNIYALNEATGAVDWQDNLGSAIATSDTPTNDLAIGDGYLLVPAGPNLVAYASSVPVVTGVSPSSGPAGANSAVTIAGTGFTGATTVSFGGTPANSFAVVADNKIQAVSPAEPGGTVDVRVTTPAGTSPVTSADRFTYVQNAPTVTAISPAGGPTTGATSVTISGSGFGTASAVHFGSVAAAAYTVMSDTRIVATSPSEASGTVDVTVANPAGTSPTSSADQFTFVTPPVVTSLCPAAGPTLGGTTVTIKGLNFTNATSVQFGSAPAVKFKTVSDIHIDAVSPAENAGSVDVRVTTTFGGTSAATSSDQYTFSTQKVKTQC
jgi:outer membrane protein assembly factor BamB